MDFEEIGTVSTFGQAKPGSLLIMPFDDGDILACKLIPDYKEKILALQPSEGEYDSVGLFVWSNENTDVLVLDDYHFRLLMPKKADNGLTSETGVGLGQIIKTPDGHYMKAESNGKIAYVDLADGVLGNHPHSPYVTFRNWEIRHKTLEDLKPILTFPFPQKGSIKPMSM